MVSSAAGGSSFSSLDFGASSDGARTRSNLPSLPIRYEFRDPGVWSQRTRIHPSAVTSLITVPSLGSGPSCVSVCETKCSQYYGVKGFLSKPHRPDLPTSSHALGQSLSQLSSWLQAPVPRTLDEMDPRLLNPGPNHLHPL